MRRRTVFTARYVMRVLRSGYLCKDTTIHNYSTKTTYHTVVVRGHFQQYAVIRIVRTWYCR